MTRGAPAELGTTRVSQNGYEYTKTDTGWKLTHRHLAELKLGRPLNANERVVFRDGDKTNLKPGNLVIKPKHTSTIRKRITEIELRISELQYERLQLIKKLKEQSPETSS